MEMNAPERNAVHLRLLYMLKCRFFNPIICHCIAANRNTTAVNHKVVTRIVFTLIICIWVTHIEGEMITTPRVKTVGIDEIKTFGALSVALASFGA